MNSCRELLKLPAYYINLDRRPDRNANIRYELNNVGWTGPITRVPAIDGLDLPDDEFSVYKARYLARDKAFVQMSDRRPRQWWAGMFACTLSHILAFTYAAEDGHENFAVFEDDAHFESDFINALPWDVDLKPGLIIPGHNGQNGGSNLPGWSPVFSEIWGTHAYMVFGEDARAKILASWEPMNMNPDKAWWDIFDEVGAITYYPRLIRPSGSESNINVRK